MPKFSPEPHIPGTVKAWHAVVEDLVSVVLVAVVVGANAVADHRPKENSVVDRSMNFILSSFD